jgi:hypothetical protein
VVSLVGSNCHAGFILLFAWLGIREMALINIASAAVYLISYGYNAIPQTPIF